VKALPLTVALLPVTTDPGVTVTVGVAVCACAVEGMTALAALREQGRSAQTANHHSAAIRALVHWCSDRGRIRAVPMRGVESFNVEEDLRHIRRSLTDDELAGFRRRLGPTTVKHGEAYEEPPQLGRQQTIAPLKRRPQAPVTFVRIPEGSREHG